MAKKYVGTKTLEAFMQIVKTALGDKIDVAAIVNSLDSDAVDVPLSAAQGKALKEMVTAITGEGGDGSAAVLYKDLVTSLENYNAETDAGKAVAVVLVKALQDQIDSMIAKDDQGNPLPDGKVADADKLDGKDSTDFVLRTDVVEDWANYNAEAEVAQVVAAALIKAVADQVTAMSATDEEGNIIPGKAKDSERLGGELPEFYAKASDLKNQVTDKIGQPDGIAPLGPDGKVPAENLPSYVDDVIEGYLLTVAGVDGAADTLTFYEEAAHETAIVGEKGKIYVDIGSVHNNCYRWSGTTYVKVAGSEDMVEITADEIQAMWDEIVADDTEVTT